MNAQTLQLSKFHKTSTSLGLISKMGRMCSLSRYISSTIRLKRVAKVTVTFLLAMTIVRFSTQVQAPMTRTLKREMKNSLAASSTYLSSLVICRVPSGARTLPRRSSAVLAYSNLTSFSVQQALMLMKKT